MNIHEDVPKKFLATLPRFEPKIPDATAIMTYKRCPRLYFLSLVLGYQPTQNPPYFAWGSAYHIFREHLQLFINKFTEEGHDNAAIRAYQPAIDKALEYWDKHGQDEPPDSKFPHCTRGMLITACDVAYKQVISDIRSKRIKVIATEQAFTIKLPIDRDFFNSNPPIRIGENEESYYLIGGRVDEVIKKNGVVFGRDFKTTAGKNEEWYSRSLEPNYQFTLYTYVERQLTNLNVLGQIVEVLNVDKKKGPILYELLTERTPGQLERWLEEQRYWLGLIDQSRKHDMYPMNESSCWNCPMHSVCKKSSENGMLTQLRMYYKVRPWNFYEVRD